MKIIHLSLSLICLSLFGCKSSKEKLPPDITGTWALSSMTIRGKHSEWTNNSPFGVAFTNGIICHYSTKNKDLSFKGNYAVYFKDDLPYPCLDMSYPSNSIPSEFSDSTSSPLKAIYKIEGKTLTIYNRRDKHRPVIMNAKENRDSRTLIKINPTQPL